MASKFRYDDEEDPRRLGLIGLLKVHSRRSHITRLQQQLILPEHSPQALSPRPFQARLARIPHYRPNLHDRFPLIRHRSDRLHPLLLELRPAHRLHKRHPPTMGRLIPA